MSKKVLQYAVILLGFGLNLSVILETGKQSLPIIVTTISTSLIIAYLLHKVMHVPGNISTLVGVGSSICGALQLPQQHRSLMRMMKKLHRQSLLSSFSTCSPHCSSVTWCTAWIFNQKRGSLRYLCRNCDQRYLFRNCSSFHLGFALRPRFCHTG